MMTPTVPAPMADARTRLVRRSALLAMLAVASVAPPVAARDAAAPTERQPIDLVRESVTRVVAVLQTRPAGAPLTAPKRAEIRRIAEALFDFDEMARRALGPHWKGRSAQEQAEFVPLFVDLLERSYLTAIGHYPLSAITFQGESVDGAHADVRSRVITDRHDMPVEYRLLRSGGRWAVYDVVANGVSLISSYRSQFNSIIRTSSFAALLERLRSREASASPRQGP